MTLVLGAKEHTGGPQTHVLIIGVGRYKHLIGGEGPETPDLPPLGQLRSPPVSARALADWFTSGTYDNPEAPLGSVELLMSDASGQQYIPAGGGGGAAQEIAAATLPNIRAAFNEWYFRCNADVNNVAFFYFCGHGLQREERLLLPEDFAQNPLAKWDTAIDFDATYRGMGECQAKTQYYVIDACRNYSPSMLQSLDIEKAPTLKGAMISKLRPRSAPTLFATGFGLPAFGDTGGVSRLTASLIECLNGGAAKYRGGRWRITTSTLGLAVQELIRFNDEDRPIDERQLVDPTISEYTEGERLLHVLKDDAKPDVIVAFKCAPDSVVHAARFYYEQQGKRYDAPADGLWSTKIPAGDYDFGVSFANGERTAEPMRGERIEPPVYPIPLETQEV